MTAVKVCGLTRPQDAQAAAAAGADALGLIFAAESPRRVTVPQARSIVRSLPPHIVRVGVFVNQSETWVKGVFQQVGLDRFQFHGEESAAYLRNFDPSRVIRAMRPRPGAAVPSRDPAPGAAALLVDAFSRDRRGGTGAKADWVYARALKRFGKPLILSGGLTAENVAEAIREVGPDMVDVSSGVELAPGIKDPKMTFCFIQAVRAVSALKARS